MAKRKFRWLVWDFDMEGEAYVIAKDECPKEADVPDFICREDNIHPDCKPEMEVREGWCKYQVRSDWASGDGGPRGSYVAYIGTLPPRDKDGNKKRGWFPVWIVRKEGWY